jgi:hypothetical protein
LTFTCGQARAFGNDAGLDEADSDEAGQALQ